MPSNQHAISDDGAYIYCRHTALPEQKNLSRSPLPGSLEPYGQPFYRVISTAGVPVPVGMATDTGAITGGFIILDSGINSRRVEVEDYDISRHGEIIAPVKPVDKTVSVQGVGVIFVMAGYTPDAAAITREMR
jgi:hypothetical protein